MTSERQDEIAAWMLDLAQHGAPEPLDPEDLAAIEEGLADIERGDFATEEEVAVIFRRLKQAGKFEAFAARAIPSSAEQGRVDRRSRDGWGCWGHARRVCVVYAAPKS